MEAYLSRIEREEAIKKKVVLGVDGGGTKTAVLAVSLAGDVIAWNVGGPSNYHGLGARQAMENIASALSPVVQKTLHTGGEVVAVAYGLSALDRRKDKEVLEDVTDKIARDFDIEAMKRHKVLVNDTFLILRAGTKDGVGVAVVSGTGANTVGKNKAGKEFRVGGLASELGDSGGAVDIAVAALSAARRGKDGRGKKTVLEERIVSALGIDEIEDIVDFMIGEEKAGLGTLASLITPLVFEAAEAQDEVAMDILVQMGKELGLCARLVARALFAPGENFPLVMGGSTLTKPSCPIFRETLVKDLKSEFPYVTPVLLDCPPVTGAILLAIDLLENRKAVESSLLEIWKEENFQVQIKSRVAEVFSRNTEGGQ
jgi:N-acetylglucosamine kinase-like BadF-type ATPase